MLNFQLLIITGAFLHVFKIFTQERFSTSFKSASFRSENGEAGLD